MSEKHFKKQTGAIRQILLFFSISLFSILLELKYIYIFFSKMRGYLQSTY